MKKTDTFRTYWNLVSCKCNETVWGTKAEAIAAAKVLQRFLQSKTGVEVRCHGSVHFTAH